MQTIFRLHWRTYLIGLVFCCVIGFGFTVRTYHLDFPLLTFDEAFSWGMGRFSPREIVQRTGADVHPPLYYVILHYWVEVFGAGLMSPRLLSAFLGIACAPMAYLVCVEAAADTRGASRAVVRQGALLVALLMALHVSQVESSRSMRMYSLGVFLAGATTWLLLRAMRPERSGWWWFGYGLAVALFAYTHYYALFSIAGQCLFVIGTIVRRWRRGSFRAVRETILGFTYAAVVALVLYGPWLPSFWSQVHAVRRDYWIPPLSWQAVEKAFFTWTSGRTPTSSVEAHAWFAVVGLVLLFTLCRGGPGARLFVVSAATPWLLSVGVSLATRSIFVERYLVFAQVPMLCSLGVTWRCLPGFSSRVVLATVLIGTFGSGLVDYMRQLPDHPNNLAEAASFVQMHSQAGDVFLVEDACEVNLFGYYLARSQVKDVTVRTLHTSARIDRLHFGSCLLSLSPSDIYPATGQSNSRFPQRHWMASYADPSGHSVGVKRRIVLRRTFEGEKGTQFNVILSE